MTALLPSMSTTEDSVPNSTRAVPSSRILMFFTLPTSTPAMRTKLPLSKPDTVRNSAVYVVSSSKRS